MGHFILIKRNEGKTIWHPNVPLRYVDFFEEKAIENQRNPEEPIPERELLPAITFYLTYLPGRINV